MALRTPSSIACVSILIVGLTLWLYLPCHARSASQSQSQSKRAALPILQMDLGNEAGGLGYEPLEALSSAIVRHPSTRFLQITWADIVGSLSATITVLYDRHHKTIKYYCYGGHNAAGNPADRVYGHYLYTGATEARIRQAADYNKPGSSFSPVPYPNAVKNAPTFRTAGTEGSYYDSLLLFGCHRIKLP